MINSFVNFYCRLLETRGFVVVLLIGTLFYWYFGIMGTLSMSAKLDTGKILPRDSPVRRPNRLIEDYCKFPSGPSKIFCLQYGGNTTR